jgi:hypothetical protein
LLAYWPPGWNRLNGSAFGPADNFLLPPQNLTINGEQDSFSPKFADQCTTWLEDVPTDESPFDYANILIIGNGQCASACSLFINLLQELHEIKIATFGVAKKSHSGMTGGVVAEWSILDSEVKVRPSKPSADRRVADRVAMTRTQTADLKNNSLAGPDLLVSGNFRHNWR